MRSCRLAPVTPPPRLWSCSSRCSIHDVGTRFGHPACLLSLSHCLLLFDACVVPVNVFIICCISAAVHPVTNSPIIIWLIALVQRPPIQSQMTFLWHFRSVLQVHCVRFFQYIYFLLDFSSTVSFSSTTLISVCLFTSNLDTSENICLESILWVLEFCNMFL